VVVISMAMCVALPILLILAPSAWAGLLIMAAVGWAGSFFVPPVFARVSLSASREHSGAVFGVFGMASFIGSSITPIIVGYILDTMGRYDIGFLTISIIAILGLIGSVLFWKKAGLNAVRVDSFQAEGKNIIASKPLSREQGAQK
jgi:MFS family permease